MWAILPPPPPPPQIIQNSNWCCIYLDCETVDGLFQWLCVDRFTVSPAVQIENPQQHIGILGVIMFQIPKSCEYVFSGRYSVKSLHGVWVWPFSQKFLLYDQETCFTGISEELSCVCKSWTIFSGCFLL